MQHNKRGEFYKDETAISFILILVKEGCNTFGYEAGGEGTYGEGTYIVRYKRVLSTVNRCPGSRLSFGAKNNASGSYFLHSYFTFSGLKSMLCVKVSGCFFSALKRE
jgi:hypothetical protein